MAGLEVAAAFDGNQALELFRSFEPDGLVLDVMIPSLNGFTVTERDMLRNAPSRLSGAGCNWVIVGNLSVDLTRRKACRAEEHIRLIGMEFSLL